MSITKIGLDFEQIRKESEFKKYAYVKAAKDWSFADELFVI